MKLGTLENITNVLGLADIVLADFEVVTGCFSNNILAACDVDTVYLRTHSGLFFAHTVRVVCVFGGDVGICDMATVRGPHRRAEGVSSLINEQT